MKKHLQNSVFAVVSQASEELNIHAYVIGGFVRDIFLNKESKDIDIVTTGDGIELAKKVSEKLQGSHYSFFKNFGTANVKFGDLEIEFVGARKESYRGESRKPDVEPGTLEDDQNRRDFTMNVLALSLQKENFGELIDPFDGLKDIENKIIRTPLDPDITYSDDPLRMMRAIRFASQLGFVIEQNSFQSICKNAERISIVSKERIADELNKIMLSPSPSVRF